MCENRDGTALGREAVMSSMVMVCGLLGQLGSLELGGLALLASHMLVVFECLDTKRYIV